MVKCKYCGKEFDNPQKLGGHVTHCKMNPNYEKNKLNCNNFTTKDDNKRYGSIDLGLNNICTLTSNVCQSIIYTPHKVFKILNNQYKRIMRRIESNIGKLCVRYIKELVIK